MLKPRTFYSLALYLLLPYIFIRLAWRGRKQPEYLRHIGERFGFYSQQLNSDKPVIWLHAVSVGETRATQSLVTQLRAQCIKCVVRCGRWLNVGLNAYIVTWLRVSEKCL